MNSTHQRRSNGTYAPGVSGNPTGRPPGLSSFKTLADESQFSKRLFEILVAKCEEGDMQAIKIVADRLWPRPRPEINVVDPQVVSFRWLHPGESETDRP